MTGEAAKLKELDSLSNKAEKIFDSLIYETVTDYLDTIKSKKDLEEDFFKEPSIKLIDATEKLFAGAFLLGIYHAKENIELADSPAEPYKLPFYEASEFLKAKIPMTKKEWEALEPKVRFRAFTVAAFTQVHIVNAVKTGLTNFIDRGTTFQESVSLLTAFAKEQGANFTPGYWETVYRTNIQTAYIAGKLKQYENNPPAAWQQYMRSVY